MKAFQITQTTRLPENKKPLKKVDVDKPIPSAGEVLLKVHACGICHTELDEIEGRTPPPKYPVIPGHQVIGTVVENHGSGEEIREGDRVGVAWIIMPVENVNIAPQEGKIYVRISLPPAGM